MYNCTHLVGNHSRRYVSTQNIHGTKICLEIQLIGSGYRYIIKILLTYAL